MGTDLSDSDWGNTIYFITGHWDPSDKVFEPLNSETQCSYITVAVDLVMRKIKEPVRLSIETPIKVYAANETFWSFGRKQVTHQFYLNLQQVILFLNFKCDRNMVKTMFFCLILD